MPEDAATLTDYGISATMHLVVGIAVAVFFARAIRLAHREERTGGGPLWRIALLRALLAIFILSLVAFPIPCFLMTVDFASGGLWVFALPPGVIELVLVISIIGGIIQVLAIFGLFYCIERSLALATWRSFPFLRALEGRCRACRFWLNRRPTVIRFRSLVKKYDRQLW